MDRSQQLVGELLGRCTFPPAGADATCAVSGGADSLALLALSCAADLVVTAVHVDHGLRSGSAAEADVVADAAHRFGASFRSETVIVAAGSDLEARARSARRAVLGDRAMTGHTLDDQAETVLINLMRGAGSQGLAAMRPGFRHPILGLRRSETVDLCLALGLDPVVDPSNTDTRFVRNRIRHELLPLMNEIASRDTAPLLARSSDHLRSHSDFVVETATEIDATDCASLRAMPPPLAREALRQWLSVDSYAPSSADLDRVWLVVQHEAVACEVAGGRRVSRSQGVLAVN